MHALPHCHPSAKRATSCRTRRAPRSTRARARDGRCTKSARSHRTASPETKPSAELHDRPQATEHHAHREPEPSTLRGTGAKAAHQRQHQSAESHAAKHRSRQARQRGRVSGRRGGSDDTRRSRRTRRMPHRDANAPNCPKSAQCAKKPGTRTHAQPSGHTPTLRPTNESTHRPQCSPAKTARSKRAQGGRRSTRTRRMSQAARPQRTRDGAKNPSKTARQVHEMPSARRDEDAEGLVRDAARAARTRRSTRSTAATNRRATISEQPRASNGAKPRTRAPKSRTSQLDVGGGHEPDGQSARSDQTRDGAKTQRVSSPT